MRPPAGFRIGKEGEQQHHARRSLPQKGENNEAQRPFHGYTSSGLLIRPPRRPSVLPCGFAWRLGGADEVRARQLRSGQRRNGSLRAVTLDQLPVIAVIQRPAGTGGYAGRFFPPFQIVPAEIAFGHFFSLRIELRRAVWAIPFTIAQPTQRLSSMDTMPFSSLCMACVGQPLAQTGFSQ